MCRADLDITISCLEFPLAVSLCIRCETGGSFSRATRFALIAFSAIIAFNMASSNARTRFFFARITSGRRRILFRCETTRDDVYASLTGNRGGLVGAFPFARKCSEQSISNRSYWIIEWRKSKRVQNRPPNSAIDSLYSECQLV